MDFSYILTHKSKHTLTHWNLSIWQLKNAHWSIILIPITNGYAYTVQISNVRRRTSCLKLKRSGNGRPFGRRALGSRSSSKKG